MSGNKANIIAVLGATGSGKSHTVKEILSKKPWDRLMIWDMMREYGMYAKPHSSINQVIDTLMRAGKRRPFNISFNCEVENRKQRSKQFDLFCGMAYSASEQIGHLTLIVDELKFVTSAQFAPEPWSMVSSTGRHKGMTVIGMSQRPAQIDKDFLGNCTVIRTFRLGHTADRKAVADAMDIDYRLIACLKGHEYIEKDFDTHEFTTNNPELEVKLKNIFTSSPQI